MNYNLPFIIVLFAVNVFMAVMGHLHYGDEGWYSYYIYQITEGGRPYIDFFFHRLPLFIETYAIILKPFEINLLNLRLLSGVVSFLMYIALFTAIKKIVGGRYAVLGVLLLLSVFNGLKFYTTLQSYSLVALLFIISVIISNSNNNNIVKFSIMGILFVIIQWIRYPIDYIPVAYIIFIFLYSSKNYRTLLVSLSLFILAHFALLYFYYSPNFYFDQLFTLSQNTQTPFSEKVIMLGKWIYKLVKQYTVILIITIYVLYNYFKIFTIKDISSMIYERPWFSLSLLLIMGNFLMYGLSRGNAIQMIYVMPLVVLILVFLIDKINLSFKPVINMFIYTLILLSTLYGIVGDASYSFFYNKSHAKIMDEIGDKIELHTTEHKDLLVFGSMFGFVSKRQLIKGCEFDLYGLKHDYPDSVRKQYSLLNPTDVLDLVKGKKVDYIIVNDRMLNPDGMGKVLGEVREPLLEAVSNNYESIPVDDRVYEENIGIFELYKKID